MQTCKTAIAVLWSSEVTLGKSEQSSLLQLMQAHQVRLRKCKHLDTIQNSWGWRAAIG